MNDEEVNGEFYASIEIIWFLFSFLILEWTVSWLIIGSSIEVMMWFLFSFLNYFRMLNHSCILGILANPTWSWCMILLRCYWISLLIFCWEFFASVFISDTGLHQDTGLYFSFLYVIFLAFILGWCWPNRMSSEAFFPLQYFGKFEKNRC